MKNVLLALALMLLATPALADNQKITAMTGASGPLAGNEVIPYAISGNSTNYNVPSNFLTGRKVFSLAAYGALGVAADDCPAIQNAINAAAAYQRGGVVVADSITYNCLTGLHYDPSLVSIEWNNATLNAHNMTTGPLLTIGQAGGYQGEPSERNIFENLDILGPGKSSSVDMFYFNSTGGNATSRSVMQNIHESKSGGSYGFRNALVFANNAYIISLYSMAIFDNAIGVYFPAGCTNCLENIHFYGGVIAQNDMAIEMDANTMADIRFTGTSFDFNGQTANVQYGVLQMTDCHLEENSLPSPMVWVHDYGGASATIVNGLILVDEGPAHANPVFEVDGNGTIQVDHSFLHNLVSTSDQLVTGTGSFTITNTMGFANPGGNVGLLNTKINTLNSAQNLMGDGGFERADGVIADPVFITNDTAPITNPWTGANIQLSLSTDDPHTGTQSLKVNKVGGAGTLATVYLATPVAKQQGAIGEIYYDKPGSATGTFPICAQWIQISQFSGVPKVVRNWAYACNNRTYTSSPSGWQKFSVAFNPVFRAPAWATHFAWSLDITNLDAGPIYIDDVNDATL